MGGNPAKPLPRNSQTSSSSGYISEATVVMTLGQKENLFPAIEAEVNYANRSMDKKYLQSLIRRLISHIWDLNRLKGIQLDKDDEARRLVATEKYELLVKKLKSILSLIDKTGDNRVTDNFVKSDLPGRSKNLEDEELCWLKEQYDAAWGRIENSQVNMDDYCQIDRDLFCLQVRLRDFRITPESPLFDINSKVNSLRTVVNKRIDNLDQFDNFSQQIKTLELRVAIEDGNEKELTQLRDVARSLRNQIQETVWDDALTDDKADLLGLLNGVMTNLDMPVTNVYLKLLEQENSDCDETEATFLDCEEEVIYGNMEIIRQNEYINSEASHSPPALPRRKIGTLITVEQNPRGTLYVDNDILEVSDHVSSASGVRSKMKRPQPLPRRNEEKVINGLPKLWKRLDELLHKEFATEEARLEILLIRKQAKDAKVLFEKRLAEIAEKFKENVDI